MRRERDRLVAEWAELLRGSARFSENLRELGGSPASDSPARSAADQPFGRAVLEAFDHASTRIFVVEDLLRAFATELGPPPDTPFALQVLLRVILEQSAAAWYLTDPGASPRSVAARVFNERIENSRRDAELASLVRDEASRAKSEARRDDALAEARAALTEAKEQGLDVVKNRNIQWVEEARPPATALVRRAWSSTHPEFGRFLYSFFSAVSHGRPSAVMGSMAVEDSPEGGLVAHSRLPVRALEQWVTVATMAWGDAMERLVIFAGWDIEIWKSWYSSALRTAAGYRIDLA